MIAADYDAFRGLLSDVHTFYERDLSEFALTIWWQALRGFELRAVERAFGLHTVNPDAGQYLPKPADITRLMGGGVENSNGSRDSDNAVRRFASDRVCIIAHFHRHDRPLLSSPSETPSHLITVETA